MAVFVIGDLHLSLGVDKKMDQFPGWENYVGRLEENWPRVVGPEDTVVLAGDTSWGMTQEEALPDFAFINALPGRKLLLKGNHDYWWSTRAKMESFFQTNGLNTLAVIHNNAFPAEGMGLCGSRGWLFEKGGAHDRKIILREAARLELSLGAAGSVAGERVVFLHYPPVYGDARTPEILEVLHRFKVRRCFYGHIHSVGCAWAVNGVYEGVDFRLASADYLRFTPLPVYGPQARAENMNEA